MTAEDKYDAYIEERRREIIGQIQSTGPADIERVRPVIDALYKEFNFEPPEIIRCISPKAAKKIMLEMAQAEGEDISEYIQYPCFSWRDIWWSVRYMAMIYIVKKEGNTIEESLQADADKAYILSKSAFAYFLFEKYVFVVDFPEYVSLIERNGVVMLHNDTGPAVMFPDGGLYKWEGITVPAEWITNPDQSITIESINKERNTERRRCAITIYERRHGAGSFLSTMKSKVIHKDEWGELREVKIDEALVRFVVTHDLTQGIDENGNRYDKPVYLPVARTDESGKLINTVKAAIASTWRNPLTGKRLTSDEYNPIQHT